MKKKKKVNESIVNLDNYVAIIDRFLDLRNFSEAEIDEILNDLENIDIIQNGFNYEINPVSVIKELNTENIAHDLATSNQLKENLEDTGFEFEYSFFEPYKIVSTHTNPTSPDNDVMLTYYKNIEDGREGVEIYQGKNYILDSTKPSYSRNFSMDEVPGKYLDVVEILMDKFNEKDWENIKRPRDNKIEEESFGPKEEFATVEMDLDNFEDLTRNQVDFKIFNIWNNLGKVKVKEEDDKLLITYSLKDDGVNEIEELLSEYIPVKKPYLKENIEFQRGRNPKRTLGIGKVVRIRQWFEKWAPYAEYEIDDDLNIYVKSGLYLNGTKITSLPDNLKVEDGLFLENTKITSLPNNLEVGRNLVLHNTNITSLPDDLEVKGSIHKDF